MHCIAFDVSIVKSFTFIHTAPLCLCYGNPSPFVNHDVTNNALLTDIRCNLTNYSLVSL